MIRVVRLRRAAARWRPDRGFALVALIASAAWAASLAPAAAPASTPAVPRTATHTATDAGGVRPVPGEVIAEFDPPAHPYGPGRRGVRLRAREGAAVRVVRGGRVAFAGPVAGTPWVTVDHGGGLRTSYGPVLPAVTEGERLQAGDVLGRLAAGEEPGLHWGARVHDVYVDPLDLLRRWRPVLRPRAEQAP